MVLPRRLPPLSNKWAKPGRPINQQELLMKLRDKLRKLENYKKLLEKEFRQNFYNQNPNQKPNSTNTRWNTFKPRFTDAEKNLLENLTSFKINTVKQAVITGNSKHKSQADAYIRSKVRHLNKLIHLYELLIKSHESNIGIRGLLRILAIILTRVYKGQSQNKYYKWIPHFWEKRKAGKKLGLTYKGNSKKPYVVEIERLIDKINSMTYPVPIGSSNRSSPRSSSSNLPKINKNPLVVNNVVNSVDAPNTKQTKEKSKSKWRRAVKGAVKGVVKGAVKGVRDAVRVVKDRKNPKRRRNRVKKHMSLRTQYDQPSLQRSTSQLSTQTKKPSTPKTGHPPTSNTNQSYEFTSNNLGQGGRSAANSRRLSTAFSEQSLGGRWTKNESLANAARNTNTSVLTRTV